LLHGAGESLVIDLSLKASVQDVLGAQRKNVAEVSVGFDESLVVKGAEQVFSLSLAVAFRGVDVSNQAHGLASMSAELGLGLPNLLHVLEAVVVLNGVFLFNSVSLPRVGRCVVLGS
jgi:hypothetical protein